MINQKLLPATSESQLSQYDNLLRYMNVIITCVIIYARYRKLTTKFIFVNSATSIIMIDSELNASAVYVSLLSKHLQEGSFIVLETMLTTVEHIASIPSAPMI